MCEDLIQAMEDEEDDDSAEYADEQDRLAELRNQITYFAEAITQNRIQQNELREYREDLQNQKIRDAAGAEGQPDHYFFGHRRGSKRQEEAREAGMPMARYYPHYDRALYPQDILPFCDMEGFMETSTDHS